jgi:hypothetical protein
MYLETFQNLLSKTLLISYILDDGLELYLDVTQMISVCKIMNVEMY